MNMEGVAQHLEMWDSERAEKPWGNDLVGLDIEKVPGTDDVVVVKGIGPYYRQCSMCRDEINELRGYGG